LHHNLPALSLEDGDKETIAGITGKVPGYLDKFLRFKKENNDTGVPRTVGEAVEKIAGYLASLVGPKLNNLRMKDGFFESASSLVRGALPEWDGEHWDHSFFYVEHEQSYAVCGIALRTLMSMVRTKDRGAALSEQFVASCVNETNPWVQAFRAEEISSIGMV
jgi:hypothetical protein